jgi:histidinol dehydrogenase
LFPASESWDELCVRPQLPGNNLGKVVGSILDDVKANGDKAVLFYSAKFDGAPSGNLKVTSDEIHESVKQIPQSLKDAIDISRKNIEKFHLAQIISEPVIETMKGVSCWRKWVPIEKVGLYIPGGSAPLFSTLLMLGIPAKLAGCNEIIICTPSGKDGKVYPLYRTSYRPV